MQLLLAYACLSMCAAVLMALLSDDSPMKRTALLAVGLLLAAMWVEGLPELLHGLRSADAPSTLLTGMQAESLRSRQLSLLQAREEDADEQGTGLASP